MLNYRHVWRLGAGALTALGLVAAVTAWPAVAVLTFLLLATVVAAGTASITAVEGQGVPWRRVLTTGSATAAGCVGAGGLIDLLGTWGFVLAAVTAVLSPRVVAAAVGLGSRLGEEGVSSTPAAPAAPAEPAEPAEPAQATPLRRSARPEAVTAASTPASPIDKPWLVDPPEGMDDETLCLAWRSSYVALQAVSSMARELKIVQRRQEILDELERRNDRGFSAWLASRPRAAGDPLRFLVEGPRAHQRPPS
jgi:hypothetical protein